MSWKCVGRSFNSYVRTGKDSQSAYGRPPLDGVRGVGTSITAKRNVHATEHRSGPPRMEEREALRRYNGRLRVTRRERRPLSRVSVGREFAPSPSE